MANVEQTRLPGVGVRHDFVTRSGRRVGVIAHRIGHRELIVYDEHDPDSAGETIRLEEDDAYTLSELLGASKITQAVDAIRQSIEGLALDWVEIPPAWWCSGHTIADSELRRRTGVSIVAIIRGDQTIPSPEPSQLLHAGDTVVVVGTPDGIARATAVLQAGTPETA
ncbi:MAG TPA: cation:proton antiporter regulatory subunit [Egibacteraceae bacterium]|nr:cation:proton antiporter regulatory subunit [Egibacteraceae bacterium]